MSKTEQPISAENPGLAVRDDLHGFAWPNSMEALKAFVAERCELLFAEYLDWCARNTEPEPLNAAIFTAQLEGRGLKVSRERVKSIGDVLRVWNGIALKAEAKA